MNAITMLVCLLSLGLCTTGCDLSNRRQVADSAAATVPVAHLAHASFPTARKASLTALERGKTARLDSERLRAANTMAVLHVGLAGFSLPSRD